MGNNNKTNKSLNSIVGIIGAVSAIATVTAPLIEKAIDSASAHSKSKLEDKVKVPELYSKGFPIDLEQAIKILEDYGLKYSTSKLTLRESNPKYKDCFNSQVICSNPKQGTMVQNGSTICLRYIPEEVIAESQRMFEELESSRIKVMEKKTEHKEQLRKKVDSSVNNTMRKVKKVFKQGSK